MLGRDDTEYPGRTRRYAPSYHRAQLARPSKYKEGPRWAGEKLLFKPCGCDDENFGKVCATKVQARGGGEERLKLFANLKVRSGGNL